MAKKARKTKITETLVNQLQETPTPPIVEEKVVPDEEPKKTPEEKPKKKHKVKPIPQKSKFFDKPKETPVDPETSGINFGISGIL